MSRRIFLSVFDNEDDIMDAARAVREEGLTIVDIYAPYAVHGLEKAAGFAPSRLPWICFALGLAGAAFKIWFEFWTTSTSWPINVGGKPWNSWPAFLPITFEVMVLAAGVGTVLALFITSRLWPGKKAVMPFPGVTDDRFALILEEKDATFNADAVRRLCEKYNAVHTEEREENKR
ncbi:MAG: DUF3341 domain-containing protein [Candidatus Hydrogenedentes bacterium]|nr:DUF3341 domain-containing protein [Candidatus Hydrogenedentota bacterium]